MFHSSGIIYIIKELKMHEEPTLLNITKYYKG